MKLKGGGDGEEERGGERRGGRQQGEGKIQRAGGMCAVVACGCCALQAPPLLLLLLQLLGLADFWQQRITEGRIRRLELFVHNHCVKFALGAPCIGTNETTLSE